MKSWPPAIPDLAIILGCLILAPINDFKVGGVVRQSSYWATKLTAPHKNPTCGQYKSKLAIGTKTTQSLINIDRGYNLRTSE
jgi:hypothetical protein